MLKKSASGTLSAREAFLVGDKSVWLIANGSKKASSVERRS
jgi:hypothetical protein